MQPKEQSDFSQIWQWKCQMMEVSTFRMVWSPRDWSKLNKLLLEFFEFECSHQMSSSRKSRAGNYQKPDHKCVCFSRIFLGRTVKTMLSCFDSLAFNPGKKWLPSDSRAEIQGSLIIELVWVVFNADHLHSGQNQSWHGTIRPHLIRTIQVTSRTGSSIKPSLGLVCLFSYTNKQMCFL